MKKEYGSRYWTLLILAVAVIFLSYLCFESWGILVYADGPGDHPDSTHVVTLTPAQTLALYGTQIQGILYGTENSSPITITFDYAFPLSSIGYMDSGGGFDETATLQNIRTTLSNRVEVASYIGGCDGIVYVASSSQWGSVDTVPYGYSGVNSNVQLHCPFSIDLQGITGIKQALFYSAPSSLLASEWFSYSQATMTWLATPNNYTLTSIPSQTQRSSIYRPTFIPLPTYPYYSSDPLDETSLQRFTAFYNYYELQDAFDIRGFTLDAYAVQNASSGTDLWIILSCPTLYSYNPPVVTTTIAPTTFPTQTFPTATVPTGTDYDPHKIIIGNQNTQIMQLNLIIGQLDRIYNRMVNSGQIPVNLMPAEPLAELRTDIHSQIHHSLGSFTTSQIPSDYSSDMRHSFSFVNTMYTKFTSGGLSFFGWLGIFSLSMYVVIWFIFRGRG